MFGIVALLLLGIPFVTMGLINIGNSVFSVTGHKINPEGINNAEIFMFWGSYLGGVVTLLGVVMTIQYSRKTHFHQMEIEKLNEERAHFSTAITKLNSLAISKIWESFRALYIGTEGYNDADIFNLKQMIIHEREQICAARVELSMNTFILDESEKCLKCQKQCDIQQISAEFREQYYDTESKLYDCLSVINNVIEISVANARYRMLVYKNEQILKGDISEEDRKYFLEHNEAFRSKIVDMSALDEQLATSIESIANFHISGKTDLLYKSKSYYYLKKSNIDNLC